MDSYRLSDNALNMQASEIRELMKLAARPGILSFGGGSPDGREFPFAEVAEITAGLSEAKQRAAFQYGGTNGYPPLLEQLHKRMSARVPMAGQRIIVTTGAQQALYLTAKALLNSGDTVLCESPSFIGALASFRSLRAEPVFIPLEKDGLSVAEADRALKRLIRENRLPKFIYVIPNFQNPSGLTLSQDKRLALLRLAQDYGVPILEDDPYGELYFEGTPEDYRPIKALPGSESLVLHLSTFSKILSPGMRLGWVTGPEDIVGQLETAKQSIDACSSSYTQVIAADYLERNFVEGYVAKMRGIYRDKCACMRKALKSSLPDGCTWSEPKGGFFIWLQLPEGLKSKPLFEAAIRRNVAFVTGHPFTEPGKGDHFIRLAFSNSSFEEIEKGIAILGEVMKEMMK